VSWANPLLGVVPKMPMAVAMAMRVDVAFFMVAPWLKKVGLETLG
jgi:hypothetical protein